MLDAEGANYSAVITDINLSGEVLGWEVARRAREVNEKMPVIYMTGANSQEWASLGVPKSQLVPKPFVVAQVITAVSQLINEAASAL
jgi:CheY-like chemotaxis protein